MRAWVMMSLWLVSCSSFSDYCAEQTKCQGGNEKDEDACVVEREHTQERASIFDCSDAFDSLQGCAETKSSCVDLEGVMTFQAEDQCAGESEAYADCLASAGANDAPGNPL